MYQAVIEKRFKASHSVDILLPEKHSHEWVIRITLESESLVAPGVIVDFFELERVIEAVLPEEGTHLNDFAPVQPTAENLSKWFYEQLKPKISQVTAVAVGEFPEFMVIYHP
jgi:6-pyruvoyltetrahydropterin/6-carboxytetrahydropterin synthase